MRVPLQRSKAMAQRLVQPTTCNRRRAAASRPPCEHQQPGCGLELRSPRVFRPPPQQRRPSRHPRRSRAPLAWRRCWKQPARCTTTPETAAAKAPAATAAAAAMFEGKLTALSVLVATSAWPNSTRLRCTSPAACKQGNHARLSLTMLVTTSCTTAQSHPITLC